METSKWATPPPAKAARHPPPPKAPAINPSTSSEIAPVTAAAPLPEPTPVEVSTIPTPPFSMAADYDMDEFAQTRPPDDLFGDDFTPMDEPAVEYSAPVTSAPDLQPTSPSKHGATNMDLAESQQRGSGRGRGSRRAGAPAMSGGRGRGPAASTTDPKPAPVSADGVPAPAGPKHEAVRGDRSGTGGIKKAKLTEEELSARMEAIKLKNASLEAAHARAEADEASFREMEAQAAAKARVERQNRQQMLGEREKNRLRKLNALGGREWDAEKSEDTQDSERNDNRSKFRRGAHGGVSERPAPQQSEDQTYGDDTLQEAESPSHRGGPRGRTGRGRGPRGGRGGRGGNTAATKAPQSVPTPDDFPALVSKTEESSGQPSKLSVAGESLLKNGGSWADEMDSPLTPVGEAKS